MNTLEDIDLSLLEGDNSIIKVDEELKKQKNSSIYELVNFNHFSKVSQNDINVVNRHLLAVERNINFTKIGEHIKKYIGLETTDEKHFDLTKEAKELVDIILSKKTKKEIYDKASLLDDLLKKKEKMQEEFKKVESSTIFSAAFDVLYRIDQIKEGGNNSYNDFNKDLKKFISEGGNIEDLGMKNYDLSHIKKIILKNNILNAIENKNILIEPFYIEFLKEIGIDY